MTKAELLKLLEKYGDDVDFPGVKFPGDDFPRSKKNGFDFNGSWIDNPIYDETGRFPFKSIQDSISHYGDTNADAIKRMYEELGELVAEDEAKNIADGYTDSVVLDKDENGNVIEPEVSIPEYTGADDFDEYTDYVLSNYKGPFPSDDALQAEWDKFYTDKDSPFKKYEADMWAKAPEKAKAVWYGFDDDDDDEVVEDVNGDGDPDVMTEDTDGDGEADTATVTADDEAEARKAVDSAKESLDDGKKVEQDSTGSLNDKPSEDVSDEKLKNKKSSGCVSDEKVKDKKHPENCSCAECTKKKEQELSDSRFKNIVNTLVDKLW